MWSEISGIQLEYRASILATSAVSGRSEVMGVDISGLRRNTFLILKVDQGLDDAQDQITSPRAMDVSPPKVHAP